MKGSEARARYSAWAEKARESHRKGNLARVLACYRSALRVAQKTGEESLRLRATCDVSGALIELGRYREAEAGLREIILHAGDARAAWQATFNLAIALRRQGLIDRAWQFAKRAVDTARRLRSKNTLARSLNLVGNLHLIQSRFAEALDCYRQALKLYAACPGDFRLPVSVIRDNLGYCLLLKERFEEGLEQIDAALQMAQEIGQPRATAECLQDRCYGLMRLKRFEEAEASGRRALELAERHGYREMIVNCYYLLGEIRHLRNDDAGRDEFFLKLQALYPHLPFLRDFLCAFDVSGIINLKSL